ncbi:hypothetical protein ES703_116581 [subsurface metagenome]
MSKREYSVFCELIVKAESKEGAKSMIECFLTRELPGIFSIIKCIEGGSRQWKKLRKILEKD